MRTPDPGTPGDGGGIDAGYRSAGLWRDLPWDHDLRTVAAADPARTAVIDGATRLGYGELVGRATSLAGHWRREGLDAGDHVLVGLPNGWELLAVLLACAQARLVPVLALASFREHELRQILDDVDVAAAVVPARHRGHGHAAMLRGLRDTTGSRCALYVAGPDTDPGTRDLHGRLLDPPAGGTPGPASPPRGADTALVLLTGGTTGRQKLIPRTHDQLLCSAAAGASICGFGAATRYLAVLPIAHNFALASPGVLGALGGGGAVLTVDSPEPRRAFAAARDHGATDTSVVPAVAAQWVAEATADPAGVPGLRMIQIGGAGLTPALAERVEQTFEATVQQVYGMGEGMVNYTRLDDPPVTIRTTQGRPATSGDELRVVDEHDRPVPDGQPGELLTRGPCTTRTYLGAAAGPVGSITADGWLRTGDLVRVVDQRSTLQVVGRTKNVVNRSGEKIPAEEIERLAVALLPAVEVAAAGRPDPRTGERLCLVTTDGTLTLAQVAAAFLDHGVPRHKVPESLVVVAELPRTGLGKLDRARLATLVTSEVPA